MLNLKKIESILNTLSGLHQIFLEFENEESNIELNKSLEHTLNLLTYLAKIDNNES